MQPSENKGAAPWSFSRWNDFNTCPRQYEHKYIKKTIPFVESPQVKLGKRFHDAAEKRLDPKIKKPMPKEFKKQAKYIEKLANIPGTHYPEVKMGVTRDFKACQFFSKQVWLRGASDLNIIATDKTAASVFDHKTGSPKFPKPEQLELMALLTFALYPGVEKIKGALLFVMHRQSVSREFVRKEDHDFLRAKWISEFEEMNEAHGNNVFNPKPNGLCRNWCPVESCPENGNYTGD